MKTLLRALAPLALLSAAGCASLGSVSLSQVPENRSRPIEAESSSWGIFGIYFSNSFADQAVDELKSKCPNGRISGVYTKLDGRFYFLWTTRTVTARAFCLPAGGR